MALKLNDTCQARLQRVWRDSGKGRGSFPEPDSGRCQNESIYCNHFHWEDDGSRIPEQDRHRRLQAFWPTWQPARPSRRVTLSSSMVDSPSWSSAITSRETRKKPSSAEHAISWIGFPQRRQRWTSTIASGCSPNIVWPEGYFIVSPRGPVPPLHSPASARSPWEQLQVVSYTNTATLQLALQIAIAKLNIFNIGWTM